MEEISENSKGKQHMSMAKNLKDLMGFVKDP
jgi:hypothetical protein